MPLDEPLLHDDPDLDGGEWLFRRDDLVFGPVDSRALAAMLYRGEVDGRTLVSTGDGAWRALAEIPTFLVHAKKAAAAVRVQREVTGARLLRARRHRRRVLALGLAALVLVAGAVAGALALARRSRQTSPLLEDFGAGIRIASAARVGVAPRSADQDEFEVPLEPGSPRGTGPQRRAPARAPGAGAGGPDTARAPAPAPGPGAATADGGELVVAQFDPTRIQAVVGREQRSLVPCFRAEAERSPDFRGEVPIEFAIGNDGRVAQLWIDEPRFRDGPLRDCLTRALSAWRFEPFPGQRPTVSLAFGVRR